MLSKEQESLVLENQRLVHYLVRKIGGDDDYDDMVSIGTFGLIKAAATFDAGKGIRFATYAAKCINNEIFMHFRKEKASRRRLISLDAPLHEDREGNSLRLADTISEEKDFTEKIEERESFSKILSFILNLSTKKRLVMLYKLAGLNQRDVAQRLNFSQSYISRIEQKICEKVRNRTNQLEEEEKFSVTTIGNLYQISFNTNRKQFSRCFSTVLSKSLKGLPDFHLTYSKERVSIQLPASEESFFFLAQLMQEMDEFSIKYNKN